MSALLDAEVFNEETGFYVVNGHEGDPPISAGDMLIRIDERQRALNDRVEVIAESLRDGYVTHVELAALRDELHSKCDEFQRAIDERVTMKEFHPVRLLVYGAAGVCLLAVATAIVAIAIKGSEAL